MIEWDALDWPGMAEETRRETEARRATYPGLVDRGRLEPRERDRRIAVMAAIAADIARAGAGDWTRQGDVSWLDKLAELDRELELRRRHYPDWIRRGRLSETRAAVQSARLEAVRELYWLRMLAWDPPPGDDAGARSHPSRPVPGCTMTRPPLTRGQLQIVEQLARGDSVPQIACALRICSSSVQDGADRARKRLGARNVAHLVALAVAMRLVSPTAIVDDAALRVDLGLTPRG